MRLRSSSRAWLMIGLVLAVSLVLAAPSWAADKTYKVAYLASSSQNGFNQATYQGVVDRAKKIGGVETAIYDGEFNATLQYSQVEDLVASKKFDAIVVCPNDTVGIASALAEATKAGIKVATVLFPVGPDLTSMEAQVPGLTATVVHPPVDGAEAQALEVVKFCDGKDPCNTVIIIGQKIYPFDNLRLQTYLKVLKDHPNIKVKATLEGNYNPDTALTAMQDTLQANKGINVLLSCADQHLLGAEVALEDAGYKVEDLYLMGAGAAQAALDAVKAGRWDATLANFPKTMGELALQAVVDALNGKKEYVAINMDKVGPVPAIITKEVLDKHPDFKAEWAE